MSKKILSFDLGTGGNKATLFDVDGTCIASAFVEYETSFPSVGWYEQKPEDWRRAVIESARKLIAESGADVKEIAALAPRAIVSAAFRSTQGRAASRTDADWSGARATEEAGIL